MKSYALLYCIAVFYHYDQIIENTSFHTIIATESHLENFKSEKSLLYLTN